MNANLRFGLMTFAALLAGGLSYGDTLTLKSGSRVEGTYVGGTARIVRMDVNGNIETFDISTVSALVFSSGTGPGDNFPPPPPPPPIQPQPQVTDRPVYLPQQGASSSSNDRPPTRPAVDPNVGYNPTAPQQQGMELPEGTRITVRMIDSVDSQIARVGDTFRASVDEPISINGYVVIPRGADVVAKLVEANQSGKISGRTNLKLVLSTIRVNDRLVDIVTSDVVKESGSRGARSAGVIGGTAAVGAIIGGIAGGGKGAAIGAGSGAAVGTGVQVISNGQRVKVPSEARLDFTLSYSVRI